MKINIKSLFSIPFIDFILNSTKRRRSLLLVIDILIIIISSFICLSLNFSSILKPFLKENIIFFPLVIIFAIPIYLFTGQYRSLTRYIGAKYVYGIFSRNCCVVISIYLFNTIYKNHTLSSSFWSLFIFVLSTIMILVKYNLSNILRNEFQDYKFNKKDISTRTLKVAIYGAGYAGAQLASSLRLSKKYKIISFIDDDVQLSFRDVYGIPIRLPSSLNELKNKIDTILLAIPSLKKKERRTIIDNLQNLGLRVLEIPSIEELASGEAKIDSLRPVTVDKLLGRDKVLPKESLLGPNIKSKSLLITGAGGSIGSELCRKIIRLEPIRIVLLEISEASLYNIHSELIEGLKLDDSNLSIEVIPILGNAYNYNILDSLISKYSIDIIFHSAAYKHVPLVESNPIEGIYNNVFSTSTICECAIRNSVGNVVFISTDKAVRPTSIMGASKRFAELVVKYYSSSLENNIEASAETCFSMVRFGNVLGSSGSVVPLFQKQISLGGPVTVTHPDVTRYFMTIPEASELVIQSSALAKNGDMFLLDMGEPILIKDLAEQMITLSGLTIKNKNTPQGDIKIEFTGLRPGEKLYEELLISGEIESTNHPLIYRAKESQNDIIDIKKLLNELQLAKAKNDLDKVLKILSIAVPDWEA